MDGGHRMGVLIGYVLPRRKPFQRGEIFKKKLRAALNYELEKESYG